MPSRAPKIRCAVAVFSAVWCGVGVFAAEEAEPELAMRLGHELLRGSQELVRLGDGSPVRRGMCLYWFERDLEITPFAGLAGCEAAIKLLAPEIFETLERSHLAPGGLVVVDDQTRASLAPRGRRPLGAVLDVWHAGRHRLGEYLRWQVARRAGPQEAGEGVLMPAGRTVAGLWDHRERRYVALSRPFEVPASGVVEPVLHRPRPGRRHLVVEARRRRDDLAGSTRLWVEGKLGKEDALLVVDTVGLGLGFWYDLPDEPLTIRAESEHSWGRARNEDGFGGPSRLEMHPFATVDVVLDLVPRLSRDEVEVTLLEADGAPAEIEAVRMADGRQRFERLIAGRYDVRTTTPAGPYWQAIELGPGDPLDIVASPRPFTLTGRVVADPAEAPNELALIVDPERVGWRVSTSVGTDGRFEVTVQQPVRRVEVELAGGVICGVDPEPALATAQHLELDCR